MDVKFPEGGKYLEYNVLGGIFDLYFFAGPTPAEASRQYVETIGELSPSCARGKGFGARSFEVRRRLIALWVS